MSETERSRVGSSLDDFLNEEGTREVVEAQALKEVLAGQIKQEPYTVGPGANGIDQTDPAHS